MSVDIIAEKREKQMLEEVENKRKGIFKIIKKAGKEILRVYKSDDFLVEIKSDETPLTIADKKSNQIILNGLKELFPEIPILSEESKKIPYGKRKSWKYLWLVDPLDGTKEFIKKNGEFSINLALIKEHKSVFGLLYFPVSGLLYYAIKGKGVFKIDVNGKISKLPIVRTNKNDKKGLIRVTYSRSHCNQDTKDYIEKIKGYYQNVQLISVGSALKLAWLAEGKADIYPRLAPTMEWDIAAGQIILEESGGRLLEFYKKTPLIYNKEKLQNRWFIASNNQVQIFQ